MSLVPFGFGSRIFDPLSSSDLWDPFESFVTSALSSSFPRSSIAGETSAFAKPA
ncbi:18.1 kDa class I heat shock protein-like isoform X1 [Iris pallida]|uniref:18.1 kDa class I heat shock protein-like isoform X1 n=1 Tax=Iris pallida TaxID=29817 RepID=A0AAX6DGU0_IRIPA|nr:18.1 kDa class I heat shock protein-like isoform X1 [Iris pallida]